MYSKTAVLTIVKGRKEALLNLIGGLQANSYKPMELIVVHMNEEPYDLPPADFPVRSVSFRGNGKLPLAAARNYAAAQSSAAYFIFLDVDCIPAPDLMEQYAGAFNGNDQLWSGEVRYLHKDYPGKLGEMQDWSKADPIRGGLTALPYELFWSLNFGCSRSVYQQIGGFDEIYEGYGAEDTDFSFKAREAALPLSLCYAMAYHQHHASYHPPLNHLADIVANATAFYHKWKQWPMEGWLDTFEQRGLISREGGQLSILRYPGAEETASCLKV